MKDTLPDAPAEPGVSERAADQLSQGDRGFYAGAFDGSTPIGAAKGNRVAASAEGARPDVSPFANMRRR